MRDYRNEIRRLMITVNQVEGLYYSAAKMLGIKENTLTLLYALDDGKSHSQKQICDEWFIPRTTINTVVKECVNSGYITLMNENLAEQNAMAETLTEFTPDFIVAMRKFVEYLQNGFEQQLLSQSKNKRESDI